MTLFEQNGMLEEVAWPRFSSVLLQGAGPLGKGCSYLKLGHLRRTWGHPDNFLLISAQACARLQRERQR